MTITHADACDTEDFLFGLCEPTLYTGSKGAVTMIAMNLSSEQACRQHLREFFRKYPNGRLEAAANRVVGAILTRKVSLVGKPGGWAGGIVYAVGSRGCGVPDVLNRELEEAFRTTMSTIYKRAAQIRRLLDL